MTGADRYVDRTAVLAAWDYRLSLGDFTADNTWRTRDVSAIVPAGAVAALCRVRLGWVGAIPSSHVALFRYPGYGAGVNYNKIAFDALTGFSQQHQSWVPLNEDRQFEYILSWDVSTFQLLVQGWMLRV